MILLYLLFYQQNEYRADEKKQRHTKRHKMSRLSKNTVFMYLKNHSRRPYFRLPDSQLRNSKKVQF